MAASRTRPGFPSKWGFGKRGPSCLPLYFFLLLGLPTTGCTEARPNILIRAGSLEIGVAQDGTIQSFSDVASGRDYLPEGLSAPLLTLRVDNIDLRPQTAVANEADHTLTLTYGGGREAQLSVREEPTHAALELVFVTDPASVEVAIWGPYPTVISKTIGETVGVVRGEDFAMGIQALNPT